MYNLGCPVKALITFKSVTSRIMLAPIQQGYAVPVRYFVKGRIESLIIVLLLRKLYHGMPVWSKVVPMRELKLLCRSAILRW